MASPSKETDAAVATLLLPLGEGRIAWPGPGGVLMLNARAAPALAAVPPGTLVCEQAFRPFVDALESAGHPVRPADEGRYPLVLVLPPRQRGQARAMLAGAFDRLAPGGIVVAAAPNAQGARSAQADLAALGGPLNVISKHHCRVFWTAPSAGPADADLASRWLEAARPRPIADGRFFSQPGLFAWDRIDPASALLAEHLPPGLAGAAADLGAGWGYLSVELLSRCPGITAIDLYEADADALALAQRNLAEVSPLRPGLHWHDVARGLGGRYDVIVSNPPFHHDRIDDPSLGRAFIEAAAAALRPGGQLFLVANRHLPYETTLRAHFPAVVELAARDGFKLFHATAGTR